MTSLSPDELAGVVGLFGALTREELADALAELHFKRHGSNERTAEDASEVEAALEAYVLVEHDGKLVVGPTAFPSLPDGAEDLPHIMDLPSRTVDRDAIAESIIEEMFEVLDRSDQDAVNRARELAYDLETWANVNDTQLRELLDD